MPHNSALFNKIPHCMHPTMRNVFMNADSSAYMNAGTVLHVSHACNFKPKMPDFAHIDMS